MPTGQKLIDWTPENDAKLFLTILAVENVHPNCEAIAAAFGEQSLLLSKRSLVFLHTDHHHRWPRQRNGHHQPPKPPSQKGRRARPHPSTIYCGARKRQQGQRRWQERKRREDWLNSHQQRRVRQTSSFLLTDMISPQRLMKKPSKVRPPGRVHRALHLPSKPQEHAQRPKSPHGPRDQSSQFQRQEQKQASRRCRRYYRRQQRRCRCRGTSRGKGKF